MTFAIERAPDAVALYEDGAFFGVFGPGEPGFNDPDGWVRGLLEYRAEADANKVYLATARKRNQR